MMFGRKPSKTDRLEWRIASLEKEVARIEASFARSIGLIWDDMYERQYRKLFLDGGVEVPVENVIKLLARVNNISIGFDEPEE